MPVLHHLGLTPESAPAWHEFLRSIDDGDVVVLLGAAAQAVTEVGAHLAQVPCRISCHIPAIEADLDGLTSLPAGIVRIEDHGWWKMIEACEVLLEWS